MRKVVMAFSRKIIMATRTITSTAWIQTVYFNQTKQEWLDLVDPATKRGVYTGRTKEELAGDCKGTVVEMDRQEAVRLLDSKHITPVSETTAEYLEQMRAILDPCQYYCSPDFEHFYMSERISGNIVLYLVRAGKLHLKFQDRAGLKSAEIRLRIEPYINNRIREIESRLLELESSIAKEIAATPTEIPALNGSDAGVS